MDISPRWRQDALGEGGVDDISDEGTKLFCTLFKTKGGIPRELSVEFDLMRDKSGRILELEAALNTKGFKRGRGRRTLVSVGPKMKDLLKVSTFMLAMLRLVGTKTSERMLFHS